MKVFCFILIMLAAGVGQAGAASRVALVISVSDYDMLRSLKNPANDARAVAGTLRALGFVVHEETDPTLRRMRAAFERFRDAARSADLALVYYAGHGVEVRGVNRFLPSDADTGSVEALERSSLALDDVIQLAATEAGTTVFVLDSCRSDPFSGGRAPDGRGAATLAKSDDIALGFREQNVPERILTERGKPLEGNALIMYAAAPGKTALDGEGSHSPLAEAFVEAAHESGLDIRDFAARIRDSVMRSTRRAQQPWTRGSLGWKPVYIHPPAR